MNTIRLNLPTILTFSRIILIPFFLWITPASPLLGIGIFLIASITDFLDGYLARRSGQITKFGIILDPIADKFLVISALILLVDMVRLSAWIAIIIIVREFVVTALRVVALSKNIVIPAETGGKIKTASQMTAIILLLLPGGIGDIDFYDAGLILMYISAVLALTSGIKYTVSFWKQVQ
ncbi:MAG: CDP-diacylglycerol--glycerol-3-phosphate 3-phosphatidyltransferase [Nitrospirae bacterium GWC2_46_6]|nr:MAG: CDP-diacylglycerol--glycerol-3-phosphate 3-phosphatidyltransferase [Nitrospirae bacterium GWA2_46_11]OGW22941.1 MAG: CDP-diacylglycerol--glycerol-3-phosphate 3-phosphatidyltransferase [Nitrospirae bacterium GWC2_46_6]OGW23554.1 MAG: CDP-diacylglycerol--glycerol-3-phosphate 3-phosphatidyltransferase [Nitrospirae bacterium GWB2_47_37]HAK88966.1 CDP-diacylglycerol--glycerol-3-phosphate 3-phosphatidyltransferase [Nitrospiraceae bacterium]HCL81623.1 CDP-diacylglycerol--glycerol-3-phosphate 3